GCRTNPVPLLDRCNLGGDLQLPFLCLRAERLLEWHDLVTRRRIGQPLSITHVGGLQRLFRRGRRVLLRRARCFSALGACARRRERGRGHSRQQVKLCHPCDAPHCCFEITGLP